MPITDSLGLFFMQMARFRVLSRTEQYNVFERLRNAEEAAYLLDQDCPDTEGSLLAIAGTAVNWMEMLLNTNLKLVVSIAKKFYHKDDAAFLEHIQNGTFGLVRAIEKFDHERGNTFSTYATWWIRQAIQRGSAEDTHLIRLPTRIHDNIRKLRAARMRLESEVGDHDPTVEELASATQLSIKHLQEAVAAEKKRNVMWLNTKVGKDGDTELGELIALQEPGPEDVVVADSIHGELIDMILRGGVLTERELYVLKRRHGLEGEQASLEVIGKELRVSRETIRKLEARALNKLLQAVPKSLDQRYT